MKKITIILFAVLVFCVPCITAYAEAPEQKGATISAAVPATHVITFISSSGRLEDVDSAVGGHEEYGRRSEQTFHIISDDGKEIDKVLYGGEDVTAQVKDGYFTTPPLVADTTLEVIYKDAGTSSEPVSVPDTSKPDSSKPDSSKPDTSKPAATSTVSSAPVQPAVTTPASSTPSSQSTDTAKTGDSKRRKYHTAECADADENEPHFYSVSEEKRRRNNRQYCINACICTNLYYKSSTTTTI